MRVILFFLKCIVGILATVGLFIVGGAALLFYFAGEVGDLAPEVEEEKPLLLTLDLSDRVIERSSGERWLRALTQEGEPIVLREAVAALERAAADPQVEGIVAHLGRGDAGLAQIQELREAIVAFRASGKPAFAFAETFGEAGDGMAHYYLASAFEEVWIQPSASFNVAGYRLAQPYLRDLFDEIGVLPRFDQRKEYKGIASTLIEREQPEAVRRNLTQLVDSMLERSIADIAAARGLSPAAVRGAIDRAPLSAAEAQQSGLVDGTTYWDIFIEAIEARISRDYEQRALQTYASETAPEVPEESGLQIAYIVARGPIVLGPGQDSPFNGGSEITSDRLTNALSSAVEEDAVKAIVLRIDSPGGSYVASDAIWREVVRARDAGKPVVVSMGNVAASGGYFIAAPADRIIAQPGTITGSIGVAGGKFVIEDLLDDVGVSIGSVQAGDNADFYAPDSDFTAQQYAKLQSQLDAIYEDFTAKVAEGRQMTRSQVEQVAGGRVWTGEDALSAGLVDQLGGIDSALDYARNAAGIGIDDPYSIQPWPKPKDPWEKLLEDFSGAPFASMARLEAALGAWLLLAEELDRKPGSAVLLDRRLEPLSR